MYVHVIGAFVVRIIPYRINDQSVEFVLPPVFPVCVSFERGGGHEEMEQPCGRFFNRVMAQGRGRIRPRGHRALPTESVGRVQVMFSAATGWDSTFVTTRKKRVDIK